MLFHYIMCFVVLLAGMPAFAGDHAPVIREEQKVLVDGVEERWRLEWVRPPKPVCSPPDDPHWFTCPCNGFAFGERGKLVLVRQIPGREDERFPLGPLFEEYFEMPLEPEEAVLRRWDVLETDTEQSSSSPDFAERVRSRPVVTAMKFGDYDRDGRATEFLLQVGTHPCGKRMAVAIGVDRKTGRLHVLSTVEHPERPLVLQWWQWEALRQAKAPIKLLDWPCGDHGSDTETELELSTDAAGIHAMRVEYHCDESGRRGAFINKEAR